MGCEQSRKNDLRELDLPLIENPKPNPGIIKAVHPRKLLQNCPVPPQLFLGLLLGAALGAWLGFPRCLAIFIAISVITPILYRCLRYFVSQQIKEYIMKYDEEYFGVEILVEQVDLSILYGRFEIHGVEVKNPTGYRHKYLFKAKRMVVDVDVEELLKSKAKHVVIEELCLHDIHVIIEYNSLVFGHGTSNLQAILDHMKKQKEESQKSEKEIQKSEKEPAPDVPEKSAAQKTCTNCCQTKAKKEGTQRKISMQKVEFIDVGAAMATTLTDTEVACADVRYKNFEEETGAKGLDLAIITDILFKSLMKSVMANLNQFHKLATGQ